MQAKRSLAALLAAIPASAKIMARAAVPTLDAAGVSHRGLSPRGTAAPRDGQRVRRLPSAMRPGVLLICRDTCHNRVGPADPLKLG
jgi:hypothetical protein